MSAFWRRNVDLPAMLGPVTSQILASGNVQVDWQVSEPVALYLGVGTAARVPDPQERFFALSGARSATGAWMPGRVGQPGIRAPRNNGQR